jgi:hypothetical protein
MSTRPGMQYPLMTDFRPNCTMNNDMIRLGMNSNQYRLYIQENAAEFMKEKRQICDQNVNASCVFALDYGKQLKVENNQ